MPVVRSVHEAAEHFDFAVLIAPTRLGEAASKPDQLLSDDAATEVFHVAEAATALNDRDRRRRIASLLHSTARGQFRAILKQFLEANDMGALDLIREEGRQEGRQEGRLEAKAATLVKQLRKRGFRVDADIEARLLATADDEALDTWLDRVITASSLEEVLAK